MPVALTSGNRSRIGALLRGEVDLGIEWTAQWSLARVLFWSGLILLGAGVYGAAMGIWRSPLQAVFNFVKLPTVILLIALGNAVLNGMLAPLLGLNITLRQSFSAILMSFTIAAVILGAFSPLMFFLVWNIPPLGTGSPAYSFLMVTHVVVIAVAGVAANLRLVQLLHVLSGNVHVARRILFAWLAGNLFLGSQLCWILRPFIGSPGLPVEFVRGDAFQGNFYESLFHSLVRLFSS